MQMFEDIISRLREQYLNEDYPSHLLMYSGGKDSSLLLSLMWVMLRSLKPEQRSKPVHVISSETKVETPVMTKYLRNAMKTIQMKANNELLDDQGNTVVKAHLVQPEMKRSMFYRLLGRGNPIPTAKSRSKWCVQSLKIEPTTRKIKEILEDSMRNEGALKTNAYDCLMHLGVRSSESESRKRSMLRHQTDGNEYFAKHGTFSNILCTHNIKDVTTDEVWFFLMDYEYLPFGVKVIDLKETYGESFLECGIKHEGEGKSCGGSRTGCFLCGMVKAEDPMLLGLISEGYDSYKHLLEWKKLLLAMRNDVRYRELLPRQQYRKQEQKLQEQRDAQQQVGLFDEGEYSNKHYYESFERANYEYAPGAMTVEGRKLLLESLLFIQEEMDELLIEEDEIRAILNCWQLDGVTVEREELIPKWFQYDGALVLRPDGKLNRKETTTITPVYKVKIEFNTGESSMIDFLRERQRFTGRSLFYFPEYEEYPDPGLVYNYATFLVCSPGINSMEEAKEYVCDWLGWGPKYGASSRSFKMGANYLLLTAVRDAVKHTLERNQGKDENPLKIEVSENSEGQCELAI